MKPNKLGISALLAAMLATGACQSVRDLSTEEGIGGVVGGLAGYVLGGVIGGRRDRTERMVGAGIGVIAGAAVGRYMDRQEDELRRKTAGTDVEVVRQGNDLLLRMPAGITFATAQYDIQPQFRGTLDQVAQTLVAYPSTMIDVYGHTDSVGSDDYNMTLSQQRARSVADYLSMRGVQTARVATQGFGESQPIASNDTESGRAQNRRVEIKIVPATQGS